MTHTTRIGFLALVSASLFGFQGVLLAQERPTQTATGDHITYIDFDEDNWTNGPGDGIGHGTGVGAGTGTSGSGSGGGSTSKGGGGSSTSSGPEAGVEPDNGSARALRPIIGRVFGGLGGGPRRAPPSTSTRLNDLNDLRNVQVNAVLTPTPTLLLPGSILSPFTSSAQLYSRWSHSKLGEYADSSTQFAQQAGAWGFYSGKEKQAVATASSILGSPSTLVSARSSEPQRIAKAQRELSAIPPSIYSANGASIRSIDPADILARPSVEGEVSEKTYEWSKKAIEVGTERAVSTIDRDIKQAEQTLSKGKFAEYKQGAEDTKSIASGLGKLLTAADYAVGVKRVLSADPGKNTQYEAAKLAYKAATDLAAKASQKGVEAVAKALFPKVAPYLSGPAGIALASGQILFGSEEISKDPGEIVRDASGKYSLEDRQRALAQELKLFDQRGTSDPAIIADLLEQLDLIRNAQNQASAKKVR